MRDLVTASLLDLNAIASGEACTAAEAADSFRALNLLLESWRLESLLVYAITTTTLTLTGAASYTWGPSGAINGTRPVHLDHAVQRVGSGATAVDFPLRVFSAEEYEGLGLKALTSSLASGVYLDHSFPLASLFPWPIPPSGDTLVLYPWTPLTAFASLDTTVALPPGYERALQAALAVEIAPMFRDCVVTPALAEKAVYSKALLKTINAHPRLLQLPSDLPRGQGRRGTSRAAFLSGGNS